MRHVLVTGGAGFVGSSLAIHLKTSQPDLRVVAFDNLRRRGSELTLARLRAAGVEFHHGDVRVESDLAETGDVDAVLDCAAEPSVLAGLGAGGDPRYVLETNLVGTMRTLELARTRGAAFILLSTSRVFPVAHLRAIPLREEATRFVVDTSAALPAGVSERGIAEGFALDGARSLYGASKLCAELLVTEYVDAYGLKAYVDRCSLLSGPWQMGKVDQGIVVHWALSHLLERPLTYLGWGGTGKQVRDVLHVADLADLVRVQLGRIGEARGETFHVGGGAARSVSLAELSELCARASGKRLAIGGRDELRPADIAYFVNDASAVTRAFDWAPRRSLEQTVEDVTRWAQDHLEDLRGALG